MRKKLSNSIMLCVVVVLGLIVTASASALLADQSGSKSPKLGWDETSGTVTTSVGDFSVKVVGRGQMVHFQFWNESDPGVKYNVNFVSFIEFTDLNQDGVFQQEEMKLGSPATTEPPQTTGGSPGGPQTPTTTEPPHTTGGSSEGPQTILPLAKVDWVFEGFQNDINDQGETTAVHFTFTSAEISDPTYSTVELQIRCHLYLDSQEVDLDGTTYLVLGSTELKFDLVVANWPWADPLNLLALRFNIRPESDRPDRPCTPVAEEFKARNKLNINESMKQESRFKGTVEPKQQFSFEVENQITAYFAFANQVKVKNKDTEYFESVECSYMTDGANLQVYLTFPHFAERMEYDPSVGIGDPTSSSAPEQKHTPQEGWDESSGTASISLGDFTAQVIGRGETLHIQVWNESDPEIKYTANFVSLIEFADLNQDGVFQPDETKGSPPINLPLAKVDWTFEGFQNDTNDQGETTAIHFTFTSAEISDPTYSAVELQIRCHLYLDDQEIALGGTSYPILGSTELKFDIMVANWPWADPTNLMALRFNIRPESDNPNRQGTPVAEEFQARNKLNINEKMNQTHQFKGTTEPKQKFSFEVENQVAAYFAFANQVKVMKKDGESFESVECSYMTDGANLQVYLTFPHFEESMEYDPSVGIVSPSTVPETTSATAETSVPVFEFGYTALFFVALTLLIGIVIPIKKRN